MCLKVIPGRISHIALVYAVSKSFEIVNDCPCISYPTVDDNQAYLTINMVVDQASFHIV